MMGTLMQICWLVAPTRIPPRIPTPKGRKGKLPTTSVQRLGGRNALKRSCGFGSSFYPQRGVSHPAEVVSAFIGGGVLQSTHPGSDDGLGASNQPFVKPIWRRLCAVMMWLWGKLSRHHNKTESKPSRPTPNKTKQNNGGEKQ